MDLSMSTRTVQSRTVLDVAGEIDIYSAPELKDRIHELIERSGDQLIVNLSAVGFLDSTGLGTLVGGLNRANTLGGSLSLVTDQDRILKLFRITGLDSVFAIFPTVEAALAG